MSHGTGSSPLARGLLRRRKAGPPYRRIIPARAGFTSGGGPGPPRRRDHPRSRGVYPAARAAASAIGGSSPLARGLLEVGQLPPPAHGIIPARAGFTRATPRPRPTPTDHPRSRGVYAHGVQQFEIGWGSSPLARGLRRLAVRVAPRIRIIPARAGFTLPLDVTKSARKDHPRSRGVYWGRRAGGS